MIEILIILFRFSVIVLALAAKGNPGGIVQQQIETMGLRQWLSLVCYGWSKAFMPKSPLFTISVRQRFVRSQSK